MPLIHSIILQISGEGAHSGGEQLGSGDFESKEGAEAVDTNDADPGAGGGKHAGLRPILQEWVPSHPYIRVVDMGPDDLDSPEPMGLTPPTGGGSTPPWGRLCRRWVWRRSIPTSFAVRTQLPNILLLVQYWSCVWWQSSTQGNAFQSHSGNREG